MAQAIIENVAHTSMEEKTYSVSIKGLFMHLVDVLFGSSKPVAPSYQASALSDHLRQDLGL
ncbi:MAG: hypothetical protein ACK5NC_14670 [Vibrio sp.]